MNTSLFSNCVKSILVALLFLAMCYPLTAQNAWVGGIPGQESAWNQSRNWSLGHVPNWSDEIVVIPNVSAASGYYPIIESSVEEIPFLLIEGGAELSIHPKGVLSINGLTTHNHGLLNLGLVKNEGILSIYNTALTALEGNGAFQLDGVLTADFIESDKNNYGLKH